MIKNTLLRICLALILIPALMLSGCSKKEKAPDIAPSANGGVSDSKSSKPASTAGLDSSNAVSTGKPADAGSEAASTGKTADAATTGAAADGSGTGSAGTATDPVSGTTGTPEGTSAPVSVEESTKSETVKESLPIKPATEYGWDDIASEAETDGGSYETFGFPGSSLFRKSGGDLSGGSDYILGESVISDRMIPEAGSGFDEGDYPTDDIIVPEFPEEPYIQPAAGLLTAGEWNDNHHFDFLKNLLNNGQQQDYSGFFKAWGLTPFARLAVHVSSGETTVVSGSAIGTDNVRNADVIAYTADGSAIWQSKTDSKGMTYIFYRLTGGEAVPATVKVVSGSTTAEVSVTGQDLLDSSVMEIVLDSSASPAKKLDLMFMIDTTGSMGDEILYLQKELEDVIKRVEMQNANLPVRLSCNFYRDLYDDYIVRSNDLTDNISSQLMLLNAESANGGGDWEEAVELALEDGVNNHSWDSDSVKLMFMVLDAPPHNTDDITAQLAKTIKDAIAKGIRIIPVASSGIDKSTEFLLRTFAMTTGGTYTFLTDHSGIGGSHIEPTIGDYEVENLNDLLVRIISEYLN